MGLVFGTLKSKSKLYALAAVLIWSTLAVLGSKLESVPSLLLVGVSLLVSGAISLIKFEEWRVPSTTLLVGLGGILGYHVLLFTSYKYAPVVEANLMNYLWPLLIVLLSPVVLQDHELRARHVFSSVIGLLGAGLIISGGRIHFEVIYFPGYLMAALAAMIWAFYSLLTKRVPEFSTAAVGGFCTVSGGLSLALYVLVGLCSEFYSPTGHEWLYMVLLGLGPMGSALFVWNMALKEGDTRGIGSLMYLTPLLSTLWLIVIGGHELTWITSIAMILLIVGAVIGSKEELKS